MKHEKTNQLLVISSYPPKDTIHHPKIVGVASYTKNTLLSLPKGTQVTVLAEKLPNEPMVYTDGDIAVKRIWERGSLSLFIVLLQHIVIGNNTKQQILLPLEVAMFGGKLSLALIPLFIGLLRLFGNDVTVVIHQVISDIEELSGHVYTYSGITTKIINLCLRLYYSSVLFSAKKVIVMDEVLKERLISHSGLSRIFPSLSQKITVIPHGVEDFSDVPSNETAKRTLKISKETFVVLYFGFLAYYKGTDELTKAFAAIPKEKRKHMQLILAGGPNPNHTDKPFYMKYIKDIETICAKEGIAVTGFVHEDMIPTYFSAADLVVFPYRTLMSASGPLSMAFSFEKPFLLSNALAPITQTKDIQEYMKLSKMSEKDLVVDTKDLTMILPNIMKDQIQLGKLTQFSKGMKQIRNWKTLGNYYTDAIFTK